jgi:hypothetical protein
LLLLRRRADCQRSWVLAFSGDLAAFLDRSGAGQLWLLAQGRPFCRLENFEGAAESIRNAVNFGFAIRS